MYQHILVPIDESELSVQTVTKAVEFARDVGARITFLTARPDYSATSDGAVVRTIMSAREFEERAAGKAVGILARAETEARDHMVKHESIAMTSDRPYQLIIDVAEERGCDLIFMSTHGKRGLKDRLLGTQTERVLTHTRIPVLVSVVEKNVVSPEMDKALNIVMGEHRSMRAVVYGLINVLKQSQVTGEPVDLNLIRGMTHYFKAFRKVLHHPKEEEYLFRQLLKRSPASKDVIERLFRQHKELTDLLKDMERAFYDYRAVQNEEQLEILLGAVYKYGKRQWEHIKLEERIFMTQCRTHFTTSDWQKAVYAFEDNGDPQFDKDKEEGFDALYTKIINMAEKYKETVENKYPQKRKVAPKKVTGADQV